MKSLTVRLENRLPIFSIERNSSESLYYSHFDGEVDGTPAAMYVIRGKLHVNRFIILFGLYDGY